MKIPDLQESDILLLENEIDAMNEKLPEMKSFILPGGNMYLFPLHISAGPFAVAPNGLSLNSMLREPLGQPLIIKYLNRLSDYLFVLARYTGTLMGVEEVKWKPRK